MHATESLAFRPAAPLSTPVVVGHRGAPSYRPEHTAAGYELAIDLGAELIEPDLVVSRDGALIVRHERELSLTTDIAERPEFTDRRTVKLVSGIPVNDWFVEDFDLEELRTLRAMERNPQVRPLNTHYDRRFGLITLAEVVELAAARSTPERTIGVLVELSPRLTGAGLEVASLVAAELRRLGVAGTDGPVVLQSFEATALHRLRSDLGDDGPPMVQLIDDGPEFDRMTSPAGLREISTYARAVGPSLYRIFRRGQEGGALAPSGVVDRAHQAGLEVHAWKLCPENAFLPRELRRGSHPAGHGDAATEARRLLEIGVDGLITDAPEIAIRVRNEWAVFAGADCA